MCNEEKVNLQRGMNFRLGGSYSVILMSIRRGAPYADRVEEDGKVLVYEGHDQPKVKGLNDPKSIDQPMQNSSGSPTQNGLFYEAAVARKRGVKTAETVRVYEKVRPGIWVYNGIFDLVDAWIEESDGRRVFKFRLELSGTDGTGKKSEVVLEHSRVIPSAVKREVWERDKGRCRICGNTENLHFDHIIPYSKGGSSLVADNIQLLCAKHNLEKRDKIE